ncbi:MAG TPA: sulfotransferase [Solimonas sp.]|nr:sulfotransferase [Solimonas sp.]
MSAVLIYGARKSGSTLLQGLLDGTPGTVCYPYETKFKWLASTIHESERALRETVLFSDTDPLKRAFESHYRTGSYSAEGELARLMQRLDADAYFARLRELLEQGPGGLAPLLAAEMEALARSGAGVPGATPVFKEVGGRSKYVLGLFSVLFPAGRIVVIARDPLNVVSAILRDRHKRNIRMSARYILRQSFDAHRHVQRINDVFEQRKPNVLFLTYEQLTDERSATTMQSLMQRLGLGFSEINLVPTLLGQPNVVRTASRAEAQIFRREQPWDQGLSLSERLCVRAGAWLAQAYSRLKYRRYVAYSRFQQAVEHGA